MPRQHENDPHMNNGEVHQISLELGGLKKAVELMTDMWKLQEESASSARRSLHDKFEMFRQEVGIEIGALSLRVDRMSDSIKIIEPSVKNFNDEKLRDEGAKRLGKWLMTAITAAAGVMGYGIHELIGYLKH